MTSDPRQARWQWWYCRLLRFYPLPFRERFAETMLQTFNDLYREHAQVNGAASRYLLWLFVEAGLSIIRENERAFAMRSKSILSENKRLAIIMSAVAVLLAIPLVAMQFTSEVDWDETDFTVAGLLLGGTGLLYDLAARKAAKMKAQNTSNPVARSYRAAAAIALVGALMLMWMNLAVGIIGSEDNPVNLMYFGVVAIGLVGAGIARFRPRGMAAALATVAIAQFLVPAIAIIINRPPFSPGMVAVLGINTFFVLLFGFSAMLFRHAAQLGGR